MDRCRLICSEDGTEVTVKDRVEGGRRPAVTVFREEDARAVRGRAPEYRREGRIYIREVKELIFRRFKDDTFRSYLRFNYSLHFLKKAVVKARRTVNGKEVRIIRKSEGNNLSVTTEGLIK